MQLPNENSENRELLRPFYNILELSISADDNQVRTAYIRLTRIWHPTVIKSWIDVKQEIDERNIYPGLRMAFDILESPITRRSWLSSSKKPSDLMLIDAAQKHKNSFKVPDSYQQGVRGEQSMTVLVIPSDALLYILSFLSLNDLMYLGAANKALQSLTLSLRWKEIIKTDNGERSYKFCHFKGPRYNPNSRMAQLSYVRRHYKALRTK